MVRDHIIERMDIDNLFTTKQYGFLSGCSTTSQLLRVIDEWVQAVDYGTAVQGVYVNFQKAFDTSIIKDCSANSKLMTLGMKQLIGSNIFFMEGNKCF